MKLHATPGEAAPRPKVLLLDDEPLVLSSYSRAIRSLPIEILTAQSPILALAMLEQQPIDVVIADYRMPDAYDAITSRRVYQPALPHEEARARILEASGKQFDPDVVQAFVACGQELIRIHDQHDEGNETREQAVPPSGVNPLGPSEVAAVGADAAMFRRIEQLIDSSVGRRS